MGNHVPGKGEQIVRNDRSGISEKTATLARIGQINAHFLIQFRLTAHPLSDN
jgi:hypothetical protein